MSLKCIIITKFDMEMSSVKTVILCLSIFFVKLSSCDQCELCTNSSGCFDSGIYRNQNENISQR